MSLQVPERHIQSLVKIRQLDEAGIDELISAIKGAPPSPDPVSLSEAIQPRLPGVDHDDLKGILEAVYALHYVQEFSDVSATRFVSDLIQAFRKSGEQALAVTADEKEVLRKRFEKLLNIENVRLISKAMRLQRDGERLYCDSKILSDVRTVFHDDVSVTPSGAVIGHTLKLGYHERGDHKEFFIVLDGEDLDELKSIIERAQSKEETLRRLLREMRLKDLTSR